MRPSNHYYAAHRPLSPAAALWEAEQAAVRATAGWEWLYERRPTWLCAAGCGPFSEPVAALHAERLAGRVVRPETALERAA